VRAARTVVDSRAARASDSIFVAFCTRAMLLSERFEATRWLISESIGMSPAGPRGLCRESEGESLGPGEGRGEGCCSVGIDIMASFEGAMRRIVRWSIGPSLVDCV
jgi:hypothetical protein